MPHNATVARDLKERFPRVWCPTCNKTQPMIFDVMKANDKNEHDAADIVCGECCARDRRRPPSRNQCCTVATVTA
jgi:hypothetical protein